MKTFKEGYKVSFDYQKPDGYWVISAKEYVFVEVECGINEKNNHEAAGDVIRKKYPGCKVKRVNYL